MKEKQQVMMTGRKNPLLCFSMLMTLWLMMSSTVVACPLPANGKPCKDCVANQMKKGCPSCAPLLQCMARCLWAGKSKSKCMKKCDCNGAMITLSDCKRCMSECKCSCVSFP